MTDLLIRNLPEDVLQSLADKAQNDGKDRMTYVRDLLVKHAGLPIIRTRYAVKFYNDSDSGRGSIRRFGDDPKATSATYTDVNSEVARSISKAEDLVRRNAVGDMAEAMWNLKNHFDNVFEIPV